MEMQLTRVESVIIQGIAKTEKVGPSTVVKIYRHFLNGAEPKNDAPAWMFDLWREAMERRCYHTEMHS